jgi:hypothetical protein
MLSFRQFLLEGDVVDFNKYKAAKEAPKDEGRTTFHQIRHDFRAHIQKKHPAVYAKLPKPVKREYAHEIKKNGQLHGYMLNQKHKDAAGTEYDSNHAFDLHGGKLGVERVPLSNLFKTT